MKKIVTLLAATALLLLAAGSALATPLLPSGYSWVNAPFWTNTDHTTPPKNGDSQFQMRVKSSATPDISFGLFTVDNIFEPADPTRLEIFSKTDPVTTEPFNMPTTQTVFFKKNGPGFEVSLDGTTWAEFYKNFGFYFESPAETFYYSCLALDTDGDNVQNVLTAKNGSQVLVLFTDADQQYEVEMVVWGDDLAPVPEPGTMVLLGVGMLALAVYGKRRSNHAA